MERLAGTRVMNDMVPPGKNYTYVWPVREEYAPAPADANCLTWVYHSHIDAPKDICSGLIGPLLVCKEGMLNRYSGTRADVDREFIIMFTLVEENQSWYLDENIRHFCTDPDSVDKDDAVFQRSNKMHAGMLGQYNVGNCKSDILHPKMNGQQRRYFIAAEKVLWDYGPLGYDKFSGLPLNASRSDAAVYFTQGENRIRGQCWRAQYMEYVDATFTQRKGPSGTEVHLGILGPVIKAEVGDTLLVTFANKADKVYSILPHGVLYDKASDAAPNIDGFLKPGAHVKPGETFTYRWTVPESVSPTDDDPSCLTYLYFLAVKAIKDTSAGLVGPLLVCKKYVLNADGTQKGIDKEFYLLFTVFNENLSGYFDENIQKFTWRPSSVDKEEKEFMKSNRMHGSQSISQRCWET
ncbi:ferroxidase HEPHL1-like isoform X3 [Castor canadensis]|uniref:Ferroxidase HEPHL1-like isoform X3 n=1 Tax=Castor canadensis TaxID=51338 RepID=A0AC58L529_CASCN